MIKLAPRSDTFLWAGALLKPTITNFLLKLVTIAPVTGMLCWLLQVWSSGTALDLFPLLTQVVKISQTPHFSDHFQFYFKNLIWLLWAVISFSPKLNLGLIRLLFKHTQKWQLSTNILTWHFQVALKSIKFVLTVWSNLNCRSEFHEKPKQTI